MSSVAAQTYLTPKEYLITERKATLKSEYLSGEIVAMSGANNAHNLITMNTANGLYNQLVERGCRVFASDMRVGISAGDSYFYPDIVVCEKPRLRIYSGLHQLMPNFLCSRSTDLLKYKLKLSTNHNLHY